MVDLVERPLAELIGEILNEDAPNKYVWKTFFTQDEWIRGSLLPAIRRQATLIETQAARISLLESGWQDIDTAPRDGTSILCWNAFFGAYNSCWVHGEFPCGFSDGTSATWYPRPTHWRPLPAPPVARALNGGE